MLPARAQQEIMELAVEDYTPLFDVTNVVKGVAASQSLDEQIDLAREFVSSLIARGYITLHYDSWAKSNETHRHVESLCEAEVRKELSDRANWLYHERRPPDERWVAIGATPAGENALLSGEFFSKDYRE